MKTPTFHTNKEKIDYLIENKETIIRQKKAAIKHGDGLIVGKEAECEGLYCRKPVTKALNTLLGKDYVQVKAVISTTNVLDSQMDVLLPGCYTKSIKENKSRESTHKRYRYLQYHKCSL